jgi:hypothetical protein
MKHNRRKNEVLPEAEHLLVFRKHIDGKSKKGNEMITLTFTPPDGSPVITDYITFSDSYGWAKLDSFLCALLGAPPGNDFETDDLEDAYGAQIRVKTRNEVFNNVERTVIEEYLPYVEGGGDFAPTAEKA